MNARKKMIVSFSKMGDALINQLFSAFPLGFEDRLITVSDGKNGSYKGLVWDTDEVTYLVKFDKFWTENFVEPEDVDSSSFADVEDLEEDDSDENEDEAGYDEDKGY